MTLVKNGPTLKKQKQTNWLDMNLRVREKEGQLQGFVTWATGTVESYKIAPYVCHTFLALAGMYQSLQLLKPSSLHPPLQPPSLYEAHDGPGKGCIASGFLGRGHIS